MDTQFTEEESTEGINAETQLWVDGMKAWSPVRSHLWKGVITVYEEQMKEKKRSSEGDEEQNQRCQERAM